MYANSIHHQQNHGNTYLLKLQTVTNSVKNMSSNEGKRKKCILTNFIEHIQRNERLKACY
jgi:hypothetical protein